MQPCWRRAPPFLSHLFMHLYRTCCENFRPRSLKVRSPGHVGHVKRHHLRKVWMLVIVTPNDWSHWNFHRLISLTANSIYKIIISEYWYRWPKIRSILRPLHYKLMVENWKASLLLENHLKHSNIGLQLELTPWIGIMRPVTRPHVAEVISAIQVIKGHQQFFANNFWKRHARAMWCARRYDTCAQVDDTDRLICIMTFYDQVMTLTFGQTFKITF